MDEQAILNQIMKYCQKEKLECVLFEASPEIPYPYVSIIIGASERNEPLVLELAVQKQVLNPTDDSGLFRIQFQTKFPFKIAVGYANQVALLIALINRFLDLPGIEMSEIDDLVLYRYVLLTEEKGLKPELILGIIGNIMMIVELYTRSIESVATGVMSYNDILEQALKLTKQN